MGARRNSAETQQLGHAPRSGSVIKDRILVVPKMARRRGSDTGQSTSWVRACSWCPQAGLLGEFVPPFWSTSRGRGRDHHQNR